MACVVAGDSIAVGIGSVLTECRTIAKVGINSKDFVTHHKHLPNSNETIISLGSNDGQANYSKYLLSLRNSIQNKVIWILPNNNAKPRSAIIAIANKYNDRIVYLSKYKSADGVHPKSYKAVAKDIR